MNVENIRIAAFLGNKAMQKLLFLKLLDQLEAGSITPKQRAFILFEVIDTIKRFSIDPFIIESASLRCTMHPVESLEKYYSEWKTSVLQKGSIPSISPSDVITGQRYLNTVASGDIGKSVGPIFLNFN